MQKSPEDILKDLYVGKILLNLEFGTDHPSRENSIGNKIIKISFGWNDSREDSGLLLYLENVDEPVFVYSNEGIEVNSI